jgi:hypothetical protein
MSADLNVDITASYSLSEARKLAEKAAENLPSSDSDEQGTPKSGNSASSRLTPEQKELLTPNDEFEDELEEGEIREEPPKVEENVIPQLTASSSRSLIISNEDNTSLHLSVYDEDGERKLYVHADSPFILSLTAFRRYLAEVTDEKDDLARLEEQRREEFDHIATVSVLVGLLVASGMILWFYYILAGIRIIS